MASSRKNIKKDAKAKKGRKTQHQGSQLSGDVKKDPSNSARAAPLSKKEMREKLLAEKQHKALYASGERVLLVGEGNFSFARALCQHLGSGNGVYATCFDSEAQLLQKYPDAAQCKQEIEDTLGGVCLTGLDATKLHKVKEFRGAFRKIVFNFPHLGSGEKDVEKNIAQHRKFLADFFTSAARCLEPGVKEAQIHVALKLGEPYKSWKVVQTARTASPDLELVNAIPFATTAWDGYAHRRTIGFDEKLSSAASEELAKGAKVYIFRRQRSATEA